MFPRFVPRHALAATTAAVVALGGAASTAQAESIEQITRATGAEGASSTLSGAGPIFTSDSGRWALYSLYPLAEGFGGKPTFRIRDIVANTTRVLGDDKVVAVYGVDRSETNALALRYDAAADKTTLVLLPVSGAAQRVLYTWNGDQRGIEVAFAGGGNVVAVSGLRAPAANGLYTLTISSGAVKKLDSVEVDLGPRSISDDGSVIAGRLPSTAGGVYYRSGKKTQTPATTIVSPNGAVVAGVAQETPDGPYKILSRTLATGATRWSQPLPASVGDIAWISVDGRYLASTSTRETDPATPARILDVQAGTWTDLGGPYATAVDGSVGGQEWAGQFNGVSRNGKYLVAQYGDILGHQLALLDVSGGDLPGTQEPLGATSYVTLGGATAACPGATEPTSVVVYFHRSRSWLPEADRATVRVLADGQLIHTEQFEEQGKGGPDDTGWVSIPFPIGTQTISYDVTVVDGAGRTLTHQESTKVTDPYWCW